MTPDNFDDTSFGNASNADALSRTYLAYLRLGAEVIEGPGCRAIRRTSAPLVYDANHLQVDAGADLDAAFSFFEDALGGYDFRHVVTSSLEDPALTARLVLEGFQPNATIQGLLLGVLRGPQPIECDIRPVVSETDWLHLDRLVRADHLETKERMAKHIYTQAVTDQMQARQRDMADAVQFFVVWDEVDGASVPVAFFSSWAGKGGVGMVEDLYTSPSHRKRGIARSLIHYCVADARAKGAESVLIGARADDTPKVIYAAMGFAPACLTWNWLKLPEKKD